MANATDEPGPSAGEESEDRRPPDGDSVTLRQVEAKARELEAALAGAGEQARNKVKLAALATAASAGLAAYWRRRRRRGATRVEIHRL